jgi:hypothetical protein
MEAMYCRLLEALACSRMCCSDLAGLEVSRLRNAAGLALLTLQFASTRGGTSGQYFDSPGIRQSSLTNKPHKVRVPVTCFALDCSNVNMLPLSTIATRLII